MRWIVVSAQDLTLDGEKYGRTYDIPEAIGAGGMYDTSEAAHRELKRLDAAGVPAKLWQLEEINRTAAVGEDE